ncbi:hypothetical protein [Pseudomonas sp. 10S4]|uniref:hypothetical protein n=1 Tax=Pseudomonas sp. 10S4 TaxID=3048583 RepID=UPI002AC9B2B4|nr:MULTISPECIES: hypothetical protein [unclassified Pseudomonas]MEB0226111.1 hypothetical protein [Pseudomonas sp. 5S1]MEB0298662.1 hypothetical protein [Pseudomonas sp. 10S4]WPX16843.1 hypothetical protein RHM58_23070 [Pseudomonas sp. 10S4]
MNTWVNQRSRQSCLDLPASGLEEAGHGQDWTIAIGEGRREADRVRREGIAAPVRLGTRQKLDELMAWNGIEEMNEAVQNLTLSAHALGPTLSFQAMEVHATKCRYAKTWRGCFEMRVWQS